MKKKVNTYKTTSLYFGILRFNNKKLKMQTKLH